MKVRPIYSISILAIVLALCAIVWMALQPRKMEPVVTYKAVEAESRTDRPLTREARIQAVKEKRQHTLEERAEAFKETRLASMRRRGETPEKIQAMKRALDSPEYLEYLRKQDAVFPGYNLTLWWDFLESQGIEAGGRQLQEKQFREVFPTGDYVDYKPEMEKKLAAFFLEYPPTGEFDIENEDEAHAYTRGIVDLFMNADWGHKIWMRGAFNGYDGHLEWADNIRQNATRILSDTTPAEPARDPSPVSPHATLPPAPNTIESPEASVTSSLEREAPPVLEDRGQGPQSLESLEAEIVKDLFAGIPNFPSEADFQKTLRERFSPQRFNAAIQALNRHGPEEGIRRLKESDPEIATHIQRLIQPKQENN